ncbi:enoyl-CoA hydratase/isomerase family protein [Microvirga sp. KLBC 81]|uniref:enoyl-CoA hydratase/isomerase family protein n=1 Tax=Microvirga sp. KLBC 81 TaxID=1862707 RepID=UPI000D50FCF2|nr:enoyl-CoA hydratase/isomerase family protein [Microvirga sp. KLBC 81]PVE24935.1 enoyl-CoA hydratase/isomerase family protein [Microvirga sp. KLBC 81]
MSEIEILRPGDNTAELVLNRPAKHNAITPNMAAAIREARHALDADRSVRCILVRGAGERAFCAGTDLGTLGVYEDAWAWRHSVNYALEFGEFRKPVIAALKGWVMGGGFEIALNCDIRIASTTAKFAAPEVKHGWLGAGGFSQRLTRLVGYGQASRILLTGSTMDAAEAYRIGVCEFLVEEGQEVAAARRLAAEIAAHPEVATVTNKAGIRAAMEGGLTGGLAMERELMALAFALGAQQSGPEAFKQRERG